MESDVRPARFLPIPVRCADGRRRKRGVPRAGKGLEIRRRLISGGDENLRAPSSGRHALLSPPGGHVGDGPREPGRKDAAAAGRVRRDCAGQRRRALPGQGRPDGSAELRGFVSQLEGVCEVY